MALAQQQQDSAVSALEIAEQVKPRARRRWIPSRRLTRWFGPVLGLSLFAIALWTLGHQLRSYRLHDVLRELSVLPASRLTLALLFCALNYLALTRYDVLALRYVGQSLAPQRVGLASFVASSLSNNVGFSVLSGGSIRYRLYTAFGLSAVDTTRIVVFVTASFWLGFLIVGGLVFAFDAPRAAGLPGLGGEWVRWLGVLFLCVWAAYAIVSTRTHRPLQVRGITLPPPAPRLIVKQALIACADWLSVAALLYVLLPPGSIRFHAFLGAYLLALLVSLVSQVPGGIGVFESLMLLLLSPQVPAPTLAAALLAYRLIYYVLPLGAAVVLLGVHEAALRRHHLERLTAGTARWASAVAPTVLGFAAFLAGLLMLASGSTPSVHSRLHWLDRQLPLAVIEVAHWLFAVIGAQMLLLARGLYRRLGRAWTLSCGLLGAGIVLSLLKGLDWEESLLLAFLLAALLPSRREFYRQAGLLREPFAAGWAVAVALSLVASVGLGLFAYKHTSYSHALWWSFEVGGDAARSLRASVGAFGVALFFAIAHFVGPKPPEPPAPRESDLDRAASVIARFRPTWANLALLGDKSLLFNAEGSAFVMYAREADSFIAMGDPVGPPREQRELAWSFRELADRHAGYTVFYEVGVETLPIYLEMGLGLQKLGEEALVPLAGFSLEGGGNKGLRSGCHRLEREGYRFEIAEPADTEALLPELRRISDAWLQLKRTREKGFSLGFFDERYLRRFPMALVRKDAKVVAFANLWLGADREELSLDLMRFRPDAPRGVMDFLFAELMLWGRAQGFQRFNLGMAPFSGFEPRLLAPAWSRLAAMLYSHGEHFYNFQGLRSYKEKFHPTWVPRYLASPRGFALPVVLANVAALVSRGIKGVVTR